MVEKNIIETDWVIPIEETHDVGDKEKKSL